MVSSLGSLLCPVIKTKDYSFGVSAGTAAAFAVGIGLGAAAACAASRLFADKSTVVLSSEQHQKIIEKINTLDQQLNDELLRKTLESVDPNPDLLDQIESLQGQLTKKNEESSRFMAEHEEELNVLRNQLLASQKTAQIMQNAAAPTEAKKTRKEIARPSLFELQNEIESLKSLSDQNAREAFQAEEAVEKLSSQKELLKEENLNLKEEISGLRQEMQMLVGRIDEREMEIGKQEGEMKALREALQSKQEEIDAFPSFLAAQDRDMQEDWREQEEELLKELYRGLGLALPKKLDLNTAKDDFKLFFHANQKSQIRDRQRWIAVIEALSVLQGRETTEI